MTEAVELEVESMSEAMETSFLPEGRLPEEVVMSEDVELSVVEEDVCLSEEEVVLSEEEDDVQVGGVEEVSRHAMTDERLWSELDVLMNDGWSGLGVGVGGLGGGIRDDS